MRYEYTDTTDSTVFMVAGVESLFKIHPDKQTGRISLTASFSDIVIPRITAVGPPTQHAAIVLGFRTITIGSGSGIGNSLIGCGFAASTAAGSVDGKYKAIANYWDWNALTAYGTPKIIGEATLGQAWTYGKLKLILDYYPDIPTGYELRVNCFVKIEDAAWISSNFTQYGTSSSFSIKGELVKGLSFFAGMICCGLMQDIKFVFDDFRIEEGLTVLPKIQYPVIQSAFSTLALCFEMEEFEGDINKGFWGTYPDGPWGWGTYPDGMAWIADRSEYNRRCNVGNYPGDFGGGPDGSMTIESGIIGNCVKMRGGYMWMSPDMNIRREASFRPEHFTYSFWFKVGLPNTTNRYTILEAGFSGAYMTLKNPIGVYTLDIELTFHDDRESDEVIGVPAPTVLTGSGYSLDAWHHVLWMQDATSFKCYIDNVLMDEGARIEQIAIYYEGTRFKQNAVWTPQKNAGYYAMIDQVAAWYRDLTSDERTELYNGGAGLAYDNWSDSLKS